MSCLLGVTCASRLLCRHVFAGRDLYDTDLAYHTMTAAVESRWRDLFDVLN